MSGLKHFLSLEASAGSGKTYALSVRYVSLLFLGAKPNKILTLTFTNKAANEMKNRINSVLRDLENRNELDDICKITTLSKEDILRLKDTVLRDFLKEDLLISTIDSFFARILRKFSLYAGLLPDFIIDESGLKEKIVIRFIEMCKKEGKLGSLAELALEESKRLGDIFTLFESFYEKEGEFDFENIKRSEPSNSTEVFEILFRLRALFEKRGASKKILDTFEADDLGSLLKKGYIKKDTLAYWQYKKYVNDEIEELFFKLKESLKRVVYAKEAYLFSSLGSLFGIYKRAVKEINKEFSTLSFLDVTNRLYELLQNEIRRDFLYFRLDSRIEHILIDEFQDTNVLQYKILEPLFEEIVSGYGAKEFKTLFFVGDVKQSIYRFRGGAKELFGYVREKFNLEKDVLDTNYRSSQKVVEFVNDTFESKIEGYVRQRVNSKEEGFVKVVFDEDIIKCTRQSVKELLDRGVKSSDIALLTHKNSDATTLQEMIETAFAIEAQTSATVRLLDTKSVRAVVDFLKYLYFKEDLYKTSFLFFLGKAPNEDLDTERFNLNEPLSKIIRDIVDRYEIFDDDTDIISLIELANGYSDIESFLFDLENINATSQNSSNDSLKILTIHKSKGLEFKYVIVVDRLGQKNNKKSSILYEYDSIELKNIYQRVSGREYIDESYNRALLKERKLENEDLLNMHYVAFSRAKEGLIICAKPQKSVFEYLGLKECSIGGFRAEVETKSGRSGEIFIPQEKIEHYGSQKSEAEEKESFETDFYSVSFGLALHYCLEMMGRFDEKSLKEAFLTLKNRYGYILDDKSLDSIYLRIFKLLESKDFLNLIRDAKLYKEQPINYKSKRYQLDLLIEKKDCMIVVDYKSSKTLFDSHLKQVGLYKKALKELTSKRVEAYLLYLDEDECKMVEV